jgi:hypothetical protein
MWYVYIKHMKTGNTYSAERTWDTAQAAIEHIARCYNLDRDMHQLGEYYYYLKER